MTKKGWTRILIVIVAALWGYNIYRTVENYQVKTEFEEVRQNTNLSYSPVLFNKDTFDLVIPLEDPFLRRNSNWKTSNDNQQGTQQSSHTNRSSQPAVISPVELSKEWPSVKYFGFLKNHDQNHQLCILNIANTNYRMSVGETNKGIKVVAAFRDSVLVQYLGQQKAITK